MQPIDYLSILLLTQNLFDVSRIYLIHPHPTARKGGESRGGSSQRAHLKHGLGIGSLFFSMTAWGFRGEKGCMIYTYFLSLLALACLDCLPLLLFFLFNCLSGLLLPISLSLHPQYFWLLSFGPVCPLVSILCGLVDKSLLLCAGSCSDLGRSGLRPATRKPKSPYVQGSEWGNKREN